MWMVFLDKWNNRQFWFGQDLIKGTDSTTHLGAVTQQLIEAAWKANAREFYTTEFNTCQVIASGRW